MELEFQSNPATTFRLVVGTVTQQLEPSSATIINLFLPRGDQPLSWHYSLVSLTVV